MKEYLKLLLSEDSSVSSTRLGYLTVLYGTIGQYLTKCNEAGHLLPIDWSSIILISAAFLFKTASKKYEK